MNTCFTNSAQNLSVLVHGTIEAPVGVPPLGGIDRSSKPKAGLIIPPEGGTPTTRSLRENNLYRKSQDREKGILPHSSTRTPTAFCLHSPGLARGTRAYPGKTSTYRYPERVASSSLASSPMPYSASQSKLARSRHFLPIRSAFRDSSSSGMPPTELRQSFRGDVFSSSIREGYANSRCLRCIGLLPRSAKRLAEITLSSSH